MRVQLVQHDDGWTFGLAFYTGVYGEPVCSVRFGRWALVLFGKDRDP
jgi:hypothetical protein